MFCNATLDPDFDRSGKELSVVRTQCGRMHHVRPRTCDQDRTQTGTRDLLPWQLSSLLFGIYAYDSDVDNVGVFEEDAF